MENNATPEGRQIIRCNVASCAYNAQKKHCNLGQIQVEAQQGGSTGQACDESLCGSYRSK